MSTPEHPDDASAGPPSTPGAGAGVTAAPTSPGESVERTDRQPTDTASGDEQPTDEQPGDEQPIKAERDAEPTESPHGEPASGNETGDSSPPATTDELNPLEAEQISVDPSRVRRAPRYGRFATIGGLAGLAIAFLLTPFARFDEPGLVMDPWGFGLLMAATLIPFGILIGCVIALIADRRSRRNDPK